MRNYNFISTLCNNKVEGGIMDKDSDFYSLRFDRYQCTLIHIIKNLIPFEIGIPESALIPVNFCNYNQHKQRWTEL